MITPPRRTESLLSSLGADTYFREAVLGDMAEEFSIRAAYDGEAAARRWYRGEAVRTAPYIVRHWFASATSRDARRIGRSVLTAIVGVYIISLVVGGVFWGLMLRLGLVHLFDFRHPSVLTIAAGVALGASSSVAAGFIAAAMDDETPLVSATALALLWATIDAVAFVLAPQRLAWQAIVPFVPLVGATFGGLLRAFRVQQAPVR